MSDDDSIAFLVKLVTLWPRDVLICVQCPGSTASYPSIAVKQTTAA